MLLIALAMNRTVLHDFLFEAALSESDDDYIELFVNEYHVRTHQPNIYRSFDDLEDFDGISCYKFFRFEKADIIPFDFCLMLPNSIIAL